VAAAPLQFQQGVNGFLAVLQQRAQFMAALIPRPHDLAQRDGFAGQLGTNSPTKETLLAPGEN
jgi:hypothetical protein